MCSLLSAFFLIAFRTGFALSTRGLFPVGFVFPFRLTFASPRPADLTLSTRVTFAGREETLNLLKITLCELRQIQSANCQHSLCPKIYGSHQGTSWILCWSHWRISPQKICLGWQLTWSNGNMSWSIELAVRVGCTWYSHLPWWFQVRPCRISTCTKNRDSLLGPSPLLCMKIVFCWGSLIGPFSHLIPN